VDGSGIGGYKYSPANVGLRETGKPATGVANGSPVVVVAMADWPNMAPAAEAAS
jgi:hypothetical protein